MRFRSEKRQKITGTRAGASLEVVTVSLEVAIQLLDFVHAGVFDVAAGDLSDGPIRDLGSLRDVLPSAPGGLKPRYDALVQ